MPSVTKPTDYMTRPVVTIGQDDTLKAAIDLMIEQSISCLPVVDQSGRVVGILTEGDILRSNAASMPAQSVYWLKLLVERGMVPRHTGRKVRAVMTRSVITAPANGTAESIIDIMCVNRIQHVPIVDQGRLIGLICRTTVSDACAKVAVSAENIAADRSVARQRWTRLNAIADVKVRDDVSALFGMINQSTALPQHTHQFA